MKQAGVRVSTTGHTGTINHSFQTTSLAETKTRNDGAFSPAEREKGKRVWWDDARKSN